MIDTDLDRRVAEIVGSIDDDVYPCYSRDIEGAITALEAMRGKGWSWRLDAQRGNDAPPFWFQLVRDAWTAVGAADTLPLAACRAIVATVEGKP